MSTQHGIDRERGNILLTLLLIMGMSTLVASSLVVASVEWTLTANSVDESSAFLLAESGIEHGLLTLSTSGSDWTPTLLGPDGNPGTSDDGELLGATPIAVGDWTYSARLVDNTVANTVGTLLGGTRIAVGGGTYSARLVDNDDGDGNLMADADGVVYLFASGTFGDVRKSVRLVLTNGGGGSGWTPPYGVFANNRIFIDSDVTLLGSESSVFSNDSVVVQNSRIDGYVDSAGAVDIRSRRLTIAGTSLSRRRIVEYETAHSGQPPVEVPEINPVDFAHLADYRLAADGKVYRPDGSVKFDTNDGHQMWGNWRYVPSNSTVLLNFTTTFSTMTASTSSTTTSEGSGDWSAESSGDWTLDGPTSRDEGTFYVEGNVTVTGSGGSSADPVELSLLTEGSLEFAGDFYIAARIPNTLAVTGGDVLINGHSEYRGSLLVHEQLRIQGSSTIYGSLIVEDAADNWNLLSRSDNGTELTDRTVIWPQSNTQVPIGGAGGPVQVLEWREEY